MVKYHPLELNKLDFWAFYKENKRAVDEIIVDRTLVCNSHPDIDDLRQMILLRLDRCEALKRYDPSKSSLKTYLINCVNGYVKTFLQPKTNNHEWNPWPSLDIKETEKIYYEQVIFQSINGLDYALDLECGSEDSTCSVAYDLSGIDPIEDDVSLKESIERVKGLLHTDAANVFDLISKGYSKGDIADLLDTYPSDVSMKMSRIRGACKEVFDCEGYGHGKNKSSKKVV